ncbi:hypothetical protein CEXT_396821 [Caerostris extrusa]|uniref:Uncharacterized protein n=1 Tax=Caerostris extrusa TaxID=172846 RepID=A0AAV4R3F8_CAEEX|nr:hypothetical protein CEXT_396821 [Caerostris extrusa]
MVNNRMLGLELVVIVIFINSYVTARPAPDKYDGIPSGVLHPISGVVPISVHKQHPHGRANDILHTIRQKVDRNDVDQLDSSLRRDIYFDTLTPQEYGIRGKSILYS